jgi:chromate transport protein ChrA
MFGLWLIFAILFIAIGSYVIGRLDMDIDDKISLFWAVFIGSLMWPVVLAAVIIIGPFFGLFWIGNRKREQLKKKEEK